MKLKRTGLEFNKKGNIYLDMTTLFVVIFALSLIFIMFSSIFNDLNTTFQSSNIDSKGKTIIANTNSQLPTFSDYTILFTLVALWVIGLIGAYYIDATPVFVMILFFMFIALIVASMFLSNAYFDISENFDTAVNFPITNFIMNNIVIILIGIGTTMSMVMFGKTSL